MSKLKPATAKQQVNERIEVSIHSVSNLLSNLLKTRAIVHTEREPYMAMASLHDAQGCVNHLQTLLTEAEKAIMRTLPDRPVRPTGLKVTPKDLNRFDPEYFHYLTDENNTFYRSQNRNDMLCHLATWVFDDGDAKKALREIKSSFGDKVVAIVRQKLRDRDHDT